MARRRRREKPPPRAELPPMTDGELEGWLRDDGLRGLGDEEAARRRYIREWTRRLRVKMGLPPERDGDAQVAKRKEAERGPAEMGTLLAQFRQRVAGYRALAPVGDAERRSSSGPRES